MFIIKLTKIIIMKKIILILVLACSSFIYSQNFWTEVNTIFSNPNLYVAEISIVDADLVWVNGTDNGIFGSATTNYMWAKSEDGGLTWSSGMYNLPNASITGIKALSTTTAYISTYVQNPTSTVKTGVYKTIDSGQNWVLQTTNLFNSPESFVNFVEFWNENDGVAIGDPTNGVFEIYTTNNGGTNWNLVPASNIPTPLPIEYAYPQIYDVVNSTMWFGTSRGRIYKTINKGLSWTVSQSPIADFAGINDSSINGSFTFKNEFEGLLTTMNGNFGTVEILNKQWRTLDGGITWIEEFPAGAKRGYRTNFVKGTNNTYFQFGKNEGIPENLITRGASYSTNGGLSWIDLNPEENAVYPFSVEFQSGTVGFCVGYYLNQPNNGVYSRFFRLTDPLQRLTGTSLANNNFEAKNKINLYPNPTSGLIIISGNEISEITIIDVLGKIVYSEKYNSLNEASVNISNLNKGIYIATIATKDGFSSSQKIIKN
jgi:Secretion system C-terminal sorting domain